VTVFSAVFNPDKQPIVYPDAPAVYKVQCKQRS